MHNKCCIYGNLLWFNIYKIWCNGLICNVCIWGLQNMKILWNLQKNLSYPLNNEKTQKYKLIHQASCISKRRLLSLDR